jgi:hypothetical protein
MKTEARALQLYQLAIALVEAKGERDGHGTMREYRGHGFVIRYMPTLGYLNIWHGPPVLTVDRRDGVPHVAEYTPGKWEDELERLAS